MKIYTTDEDPMDIVRTAPFRQCRDVRGVGVLNADRIALKVGLPKHPDARLQAALLHELERAGRSGDCHLPVRVLLARTRKLLTDDDPTTADLLDTPVLRNALEQLRDGEEAVVVELPLPVSEDAPDALPRGLGGQTGRGRVPRDRGSDREAGSGDPHRVDPACVGSDRRSELRQDPHLAHARSARHGDATVALAAPTGEAAKRLEETTGFDAGGGDSLFDHAGRWRAPTWSSSTRPLCWT